MRSIKHCETDNLDQFIPEDNALKNGIQRNTEKMRKKLPPVLTSEQAKSILTGKTHVSLDLGLSKTVIKQLNDGYLLGKYDYIDTKNLEKIAENKGNVYFVDKKSVFMVATSGKHFYKLTPTRRAPTIEIDGIRMHRTKNTTPDKDAEDKLRVLKLHGGNVLDTCTGLGYTAIHAIRNGASRVVTIEYVPSVLRLAQINPWSLELFTSHRILKMLGDSFTVVDALPDDLFDYIIHDPPRHSSAGHLYGQEFYHKLTRVLKPGGRMFHYTGEPGSRYRKVSIRKGVKRRLLLAGFQGVEYHPSVMGVTCNLRTV